MKFLAKVRKYLLLQFQSSSDIVAGTLLDQASAKIRVTLQLGHNDGSECTSYRSKKPRSFFIIHTNGIHHLWLRFCGCPGSASEYEQLMNARLFPSTLKKPTNAFTFAVFKHFHLLNVESKISAYDFMGTLSRLTDNVNTHRRTVRISVIAAFPHPCMY